MTPAAEALILAHVSLVERIAKGVAKRMPSWIEMDELVAAGNVGLVEAAAKYDAALHPRFETYAFLRIRGAMIDPYRGRNYPRLTTSMPEEWLHDGQQRSEEASGDNGCMHPLPPELIDPSPSPEDALIEQEENSLLILDVEIAKRRLTLVERRTVKRSVDGQPMRVIGAKEKRSGAWAHYTIHRGRKKLREVLSEHEDKAA